MTQEKIPFNVPYMTGKELDFISEAKANNMLAGDGPFTKRCHQWIEASTGCAKALLTHSCTAALEMAAMLLDIKPGDEVIMPSYTFVSTANAFVLRGGIPVFVDIRADTLNIDEAKIAAAITSRTRAIVPVHYAGVACEMDTILHIARAHSLRVIEDAAQGVMASYKGRALGAIGDLGTFSFHETKNVISGEGGALLISNGEMAERAEILREKGTDRGRFFRGEVDKYTWQDIGSSFLPGELTAAFLWAQLNEASRITHDRLALWQRYHALVQPLEESGLVRRPFLPQSCVHNAHMYYVILAPSIDRARLLQRFREENVFPVSHYVPLHSSPAGQRLGRASGDLANTNDLAARLIRLPMWLGITEAQQGKVVELLDECARMYRRQRLN